MPLCDPMVAKLLAWDVDRASATHRMRRALGEWVLTGPTSLLPFHLALLDTDQWRRGETCRDLVEDPAWLAGLAAPAPAAPAADGGDPAPSLERLYAVEVSGRRFDVRVIAPAERAAGPPATAAPRAPRRRASTNGAGPGSALEALRSPLQGTVLRVAVEEGAVVAEGDLVCVIEAMKMENEITAHRAGTLSALAVSQGASVCLGDAIAVIA